MGAPASEPSGAKDEAETWRFMRAMCVSLPRRARLGAGNRTANPRISLRCLLARSSRQRRWSAGRRRTGSPRWTLRLQPKRAVGGVADKPKGTFHVQCWLADRRRTGGQLRGPRICISVSPLRPHDGPCLTTMLTNRDIERRSSMNRAHRHVPRRPNKGPNVRHERRAKGREAAFGTSARWRGWAPPERRVSLRQLKCGATRLSRRIRLGSAGLE